MTDIPEDIMQAATACASVLSFSHIEGVRQQAVTPIAHAILAERKSSEKIRRLAENAAKGICTVQKRLSEALVNQAKAEQTVLNLEREIRDLKVKLAEAQSR